MIPYKNSLNKKARELRKNATPQENHLWYDFLSKYKTKFRRQRPIGSFIADFYCEEAKIVIEIDGSQHYTDEGKEYDNRRSAFFENYGIKVLRFANNEVNENFEGVCIVIDKEVKERLLNQTPTAVKTAPPPREAFEESD